MIILRNDNLPKVGIEVTEKAFPYRKLDSSSRKGKSKLLENNVHTVNKDENIITQHFKNLFKRIAKTENQSKITHFDSPQRPKQLKERRVPLHLLSEQPAYHR